MAGKITCLCGRVYQLKPDQEGHTLRCKHCGAVIRPTKQQEGDAKPADPGQTVSLTTNESDATARVHAVMPTVNAPFIGVNSGSLGKAAPAGSQDAERFEVLREHARGGLGVVLLARDRQFDRDVALKQPLAVSLAAANVDQFVDEARKTGQLEHPGIVPVYAMGVTREGRPFYTMKLVQGTTLSEAITEYRKKPQPAVLRELLNRLEAVCQTVAFAHSKGVAHCDLKPSNIMLGKYGETLVLDWGLSRAFSRGHPGQGPGKPTQGTIAYMSPEQAAGDLTAVGALSDQYALGVVLYQILTGSVPYTASSTKQLLEFMVRKPAQHPRELDPSVPRALEAICLKALARDPKNRYSDILAMASDIRRWLDDERVTAYPEGPITRFARWTRHHQRLSAAVVACVVCLLAGAGVTALLVQQERSKAEAQRQVADSYRDQAKKAQLRADELLAKATTLESEAKANREASATASKQETAFREEAARKSQQVAQLEEQLKTAGSKKAELEAKLEESRAAVRVAEEKASQESTKAAAALAKAAVLEEQVSQLREDARQVRELSVKLASLAEGRQVEDLASASQPSRPQRPSPQLPSQQLMPSQPLQSSQPGVRFLSEMHSSSFRMVASQPAAAKLHSDARQTIIGRQSISWSIDSGRTSCLRLSSDRLGMLDLSRKKYMSISMLATGQGVDFPPGSLMFRLGSGSSFIEIGANGAPLAGAIDHWVKWDIPLAGDTRWLRRDNNSPDLSRIDWVEIHVRPQGDCTLWVDGLEFIEQPLLPTVEELNQKLYACNPQYKNDAKFVLKDGRIAEVNFEGTLIADITPLTGLPLANVHLPSYFGDTSALRGMPLEKVSAYSLRKKDVDPLAGCPISDASVPTSDVRGLRHAPLKRGTFKAKDLSPLKLNNVAYLIWACPERADLMPLKEAPLDTFMFRGEAAVPDFSTIANKNISHLSVHNTKISDMSWVKNRQSLSGLSGLTCINTDVSDLSFLNNCDSIASLACGNSNVMALPDFKNKKLYFLDIHGLKLKNPAVLSDMQIDKLMVSVDFVEQNEAILRENAGIKSLCLDHHESGLWRNRKAFWEYWDLRKAMKPVRPDASGEEIIARLKQLNPNMAGEPTLKPEGGKVVEVSYYNSSPLDLLPLKGLQLKVMAGSSAIDISPFRGMPLRRLKIMGPVYDLSPLKGLPLESLDIGYSSVRDISDLRGMKLKTFSCSSSLVSDLSPLAGMPIEDLGICGIPITDLAVLRQLPNLEHLAAGPVGSAGMQPLQGLKLKTLSFYGAGVADLSPLRGMALEELVVPDTSVKDLGPLAGFPLKVLDCGGTDISDLSPLKGMRLESFDCAWTQVTDLSPLAGMPIKSLDIQGCEVRDLSVLTGMPLERLYIVPGYVKCDLEILRNIKSLKFIHVVPSELGPPMSPEAFWAWWDKCGREAHRQRLQAAQR